MVVWIIAHVQDVYSVVCIFLLVLILVLRLELLEVVVLLGLWLHG